MSKSTTAPGPCHFVAGSDEIAVKRAAKALAAELAPGADAFGLEVIDGAVDTVEAAVGRIEEAVGGLLTLPFMGGRKLIWLKSAAFLSDTVAGRSESVLEAVEKLIATLQSGLPDGVTFLLSAINPDKRRSAYKSLTKLCATSVHDLPDLGFRGGEEAIIQWIESQASTRGLSIVPEALEVMAARIGLDVAQLDSELTKLETAAGGRAVTLEMVRDLVPQTREGGIFDLSGAILRRDLPLALDTLAQLFRQGEKGVGILLAAIVPTMRNLLLIKDLMSRHRIAPTPYSNKFAAALGQLPAHETGHLPRKKDGGFNAYPLSLASMHASNYTLPELEEGFLACGDTASRLFIGGLDDDVLLARFLVGVLARA